MSIDLHISQSFAITDPDALFLRFQKDLATARRRETMSKKAHGSPRSDVFLIDPKELVLIRNKDAPLYDPRVEAPPSEAMILSVMRRGVIEPVIARKDGDDLVVIDGRKRTMAAVEANRRLKAEGSPTIRVPTITKRLGDADAADMMILLNEIRENDSLPVKAKKASMLIERFGRTEDEVAETFGVARATIKNWLSLLDCHPHVQAAVETGRLRLIDAARTIAPLARAEQVAAMEKLAEDAPTRAERKARGQPAKRTDTAASRLKRIAKFTADHPGALNAQANMVLSWIVGDETREALLTACPKLAEMLDA